jgi:hypothetical protein
MQEVIYYNIITSLAYLPSYNASQHSPSTSAQSQQLLLQPPPSAPKSSQHPLTHLHHRNHYHHGRPLHHQSLRLILHSLPPHRCDKFQRRHVWFQLTIRELLNSISVPQRWHWEDNRSYYWGILT